MQIIKYVAYVSNDLKAGISMRGMSGILSFAHKYQYGCELALQTCLHQYWFIALLKKILVQARPPGLLAPVLFFQAALNEHNTCTYGACILEQKYTA